MVMEKIKQLVLNKKDSPYPLSVALGAATKYSFDEDLSEIITLADSHMYEDKKLSKRII